MPSLNDRDMVRRQAEEFESASLREILGWAWETFGERAAFGTSFQGAGLVAMHTVGIRPDFPKIVIDETKNMTVPDLKGREDLREIPLVTINGQFGGWQKAQATHFADGGVFDRIYRR